MANTAALKAAGIDGKPSGEIEGGRIEVDAKGLPTGMLIDNAMAKLASLESAPPPEHIDEAYQKGAAREAKLGWTGVHNMSVAATHVPRINALSEAGKLPLRIYNAVDAGDLTDGGPGKFGEGVISVAKGGLATFTKGLAVELAPHVTVNMVQPAMDDPPPELSDDERAAVIESTPLRRCGTPGDVSRLILYLLEGTDFATGGLYRVDGGRSLA